MADRSTAYVCPACTGPLHFDSASGKVICDYCGSAFTVDEVEKDRAERNAMAENAGRITDSGENASNPDLAGYSCTQCGATLVCDANTAATTCPYCGNPSIISSTVSGKFKPDLVIPFLIDKEKAKSILKEFYKGKKFLPKNFVDDNHIEEIKGAYVPFCLFDAKTSARGRFKGTQTNIVMRGVEKLLYTKHFSIRRAATMEFFQVPADASSKMPDAYMDSIEPFDYSKICEYKHAYLAGYFADVYDVEKEQCEPRIKTRLEQTAIDILRSDIHGYATVVCENSDVSIRYGKIAYAMLPVWVLVTKWKDESILFAINGQTGKIAGNLPVDYGKFFIYFIVFGVIFSLICVLIVNMAHFLNLFTAS